MSSTPFFVHGSTRVGGGEGVGVGGGPTVGYPRVSVRLKNKISSMFEKRVDLV